MNIVVLCGSVRKGGNTDTLVKSFVNGAKINNSVKVISVGDYKVNPCIGCNTCFNRENNDCFQNDDMIKIYDELQNADAIIIASPVYFYGLSSQLKAIIDRLHTPKRNGFKIKKIGLLLVGAASLPELFDSIKVQYKLICNFFKLDDIGSVCVRGVNAKGDIIGNEALKDAYNLGLSIKNSN